MQSELKTHPTAALEHTSAAPHEEMLTIGSGRSCKTDHDPGHDHHVTRSKCDTTWLDYGGPVRMRTSRSERFRTEEEDEEVKHTTASSENQVIIDDLSRFVGDKENYKSLDRAWKRGYLLYEPSGTERSILIFAMANYRKFDIYYSDLKSISSISEMTNMFVSTRNRSLIGIEDFDHCAGMLLNLKIEFTGSCWLKFLDGLLSSCGGEKIIVLTTTHRDLYDDALLPPFDMDIHIHTSSPQPIALPDGREIVELEQKPLLGFDATNNKAYQSGLLVSNSEKKNTIEESKRRCMTDSVPSLVDSTTRRSLTNFDALNSRAHLVMAHQISPIIVFDSEKKDLREGLYG